MAQKNISPERKLDSQQARAMINVIGPALRVLLADGERLQIATFCVAEPVLDFVGKQEKKIEFGDEVLWFDPAPATSTGDLIDNLTSDTLPKKKGIKIVLVKNLGLFAIGPDITSATEL